MSTHSVSSVATARSYDQWCPIAVGLDVLGDRWTLLVLRELSLGDRRFSDLRRELAGIAPNLLSERLRTLVDLRLVESVELPAPVARSVYRITDDGRAASPVLRALARFGVRYLTGGPTEDFDAKRAAHALLVPWWRHGADPVTVRLVVMSFDGVDSTADIDVGPDRCTVTAVADPGAAALPAVDVTIRTTAAELVSVRNDGADFTVPPRGSATHVAAALRAFDLDR